MVRMAEQAFLATGDQRLRLRLLCIEDVERGTEHRVEHGDLHRPARHPAYVGLVGEVERPGVARRDELTLEAGLTEHEQLRFHRYLQLVQEPAQAPPRRPAANLLRLLRRRRVEPGDRVDRFRLGIADRRILERFMVLRSAGPRQRQSRGEQAGGETHEHGFIQGLPVAAASIRPAGPG